MSVIGMRINKPWKLHKWVPVFLAMPPMFKDLEAHPESGFLGCISSFGVIVQSLAIVRALGSVRAQSRPATLAGLDHVQQTNGEVSRGRGHLA